MRKQNPKIWAPKAREHPGRCFAFHSFEVGHECVECGKWYPPDDIDRMIAQNMRGARWAI